MLFFKEFPNDNDVGDGNASWPGVCRLFWRRAPALSSPPHPGAPVKSNNRLGGTLLPQETLYALLRRLSSKERRGVEGGARRRGGVRATADGRGVLLWCSTAPPHPPFSFFLPALSWFHFRVRSRGPVREGSVFDSSSISFLTLVAEVAVV